MQPSLNDLFMAVSPPRVENPDKPLYAIKPILDYGSYFVGKNSKSCACLLVATNDKSRRRPPPIRLETLDAQFNLRCHLKKEGGPEREGTFTVIRCRSLDSQTIHYFLSICETIIQIVGDNPSQRAVASAVHNLSSILQKIKYPPTKPVTGLFAELFIILRSSNPIRTLKAWRRDEAARFDFADGEIRIDVKASSTKVRSHIFSYEQCNPPRGTIAIVASLFAERTSGGLSLATIIQEIESEVSDQPNLVFKLHEVVASTLGSSIAEAMEVAFDIKLADSTLQFYNLREIPAIREQLPRGVSDVHFRSDLSSTSSISVELLIDQNPLFYDLLPPAGEQ